MNDTLAAIEERATPWRPAFDALIDALGPDDKVLRELAEEALYRAAAEIGRLRGIARLAGYVRARQQEYFRTRSRDALVASKTAEKALDDALAGHQAELSFQP